MARPETIPQRRYSYTQNYLTSRAHSFDWSKTLVEAPDNFSLLPLIVDSSNVEGDSDCTDSLSPLLTPQESIDSGLSLCPSAFSASSNTAALDDRRPFTPSITTPVGSQASSDFFNHFHAVSRSPQEIFSSSRQRQSWHPYRRNNRIDSPLEHVNTSLAGLGDRPWPDEAASFVRSPKSAVEFVSDSGVSPTRLQHYPQILEPWTGLPMRHQDPILMDYRAGSSQSPSYTHSPASSGERGSRRTGPLSAAQRKNANDVRQKGACYRCSWFKEQCDNGTPCQNCMHKRGRKWKLGCIRKPLDECTQFLFPERLRLRYNHSLVNNYINQSAYAYLPRPDFRIKLNMGLNSRPLELQVKEIEPMRIDGNADRLGAFQTTSDEFSTAQIQTTSLWNPPIALYLVDKAKGQEVIQKQLRLWLESALFSQGGDKNDWGRWPWPLFEHDSVYFGGDIMDEIHQYYQPDLEEHRILYKALCLPFWAYLFHHPFIVAAEDRPYLLSHLENPPCEDSLSGMEISPENINRFVKALMFPRVQENAQQVLKGLHEILQQMAMKKEVSTAKSDLAFCLAFAMIIFVGKMQTIVFELGNLSEEEGPHIPFNREEAKEMVVEMEEKLASYIVHFHEFALKRKKIPTSTGVNMQLKDAEIHAASFNLMAKAKGFAEQCSSGGYKPRTPTALAELLSENLKPNDMDLSNVAENSFGLQNTHRLCWRLYQAVFGDSD